MSEYTLLIEHLPPGAVVCGALFTDVANAAFLHQQLLDRNSEFEYALVDAATLLSATHLRAAVFKAAWAAHAGALKTPNVHSETVLGLSPSLNISEAYRRYGIAADTRNVVALKVLLPGAAQTPADIWAHLVANVEGTPVVLTDDALAACTNVATVKKYYKLNGVASMAAAKGQTEALTAAQRKEAEVLVLGAMALRGL